MIQPVRADAAAEIDALVATALATIPLDPVTGRGGGAGPAMDALLGDVAGRFGWSGIYQVAVACARICTHGLHPYDNDTNRQEQPHRHFGSEGERYPETPTGYRLSRFVVALMQGREVDAWLEFGRWQPDESSPPSPEMKEAVWDLLTRAWSRQAGMPFLWHIDPGDRWPPACDFCCAATARLMFRCHPFQMSTAAGEFGMLGALEVNYGDMSRWYACRRCATFAQVDNWTGMWRRYLTCNPGSDPGNGNIRRLWSGFAEHRRRREPRKLPARRPPNDPDHRKD